MNSPHLLADVAGNPGWQTILTLSIVAATVVVFLIRAWKCWKAFKTPGAACGSGCGCGIKPKATHRPRP